MSKIEVIKNLEETLANKSMDKYIKNSLEKKLNEIKNNNTINK